jgi:hypothetical protein
MMEMTCRLIHHLVVEMEYEYFVANSSVRDILRVFAGLCGPVLPVVCDVFMLLNMKPELFQHTSFVKPAVYHILLALLLNSSHF